VHLVFKVAISGGKGGIGKSTIALNLAQELKEMRPLLLDFDVDEPNLHILMEVKRKKIATIHSFFPVLDKEKCKRCGLCALLCKEKAIFQIKSNYPLFLEECNGCKLCYHACPVGAIKEGKRKIGSIYQAEKNGLKLISVEMENYQESGKVIYEAMKILEQRKNISQENKAKLEIYDLSAGAHCNVKVVFEKMDLVVVVVEDSEVGIHDAKIILEILKKMNKEYLIVINKKTGDLWSKDFSSPFIIEAKTYGTKNLPVKEIANKILEKMQEKNQKNQTK
jgi:MinD superfamily P-loop ATPase